MSDEPEVGRLDASGIIELGDRVRIEDGPFTNFGGSVEEIIEARGLVKVKLIVFNRPVPVEFEYWQVVQIGSSE